MYILRVLDVNGQLIYYCSQGGRHAAKLACRWEDIYRAGWRLLLGRYIALRCTYVPCHFNSATTIYVSAYPLPRTASAYIYNNSSKIEIYCMISSNKH